MKKALLLASFLLMVVPATAQVEIGASYEIRDESPESGFGVRLQTPILKQLPLVNLGIRLHASYFSEENTIDTGTLTYGQEFVNYDFGVAAYGGISVGLVEPYIGAGLGSETVDLTSDDVVNGANGEESNVYWNSFVGAKVSVLPLVKPFVEYRFSSRDLNIENYTADDQNGRMIFGVLISF